MDKNRIHNIGGELVRKGVVELRSKGRPRNREEELPIHFPFKFECIKELWGHLSIFAERRYWRNVPSKPPSSQFHIHQ